MDLGKYYIYGCERNIIISYRTLVALTLTFFYFNQLRTEMEEL